MRDPRLDPNNRLRRMLGCGGLRVLPTISQRGNNGQEVVFDSKGKVHDVIHPAVGPNGKLLARDKAGQPVEIDRS